MPSAGTKGMTIGSSTMGVCPQRWFKERYIDGFGLTRESRFPVDLSRLGFKLSGIRAVQCISSALSSDSKPNGREPPARSHGFARSRAVAAPIPTTKKVQYYASSSFLFQCSCCVDVIVSPHSSIMHLGSMKMKGWN